MVLNDVTGAMDVLLICAQKDEYDQVRAVSDGLLKPGWNERPGPRGWMIADASFATAMNIPLHIRATWATHLGREQAAAVTSFLIQAQPARCIAMSGICAGRRGKVALGDVIFANRLWSYDAGKRVVEDGKDVFQGDHLQFRPPAQWVQRMQHLPVPDGADWLDQRPRLPLEHQEDWVLRQLAVGADPRESSAFALECPDWVAVVRRLRQRGWLGESLSLTEAGRKQAFETAHLHPDGLPAPPTFQIHVAPIATGAPVTEDEGIFPRLANDMRKVLGVEMEASALGALAELHDVPVVVAKGVSDYGDPFKDDRYRQFAARAAAECLIRLLRNAVDLLANREVEATAAAVRLDGSSIEDAATGGNLVAARSRESSPMTDIPRALIEVLAEEYPDVRDARALWQRAGGRASEVENIPRPRDLWQRLWIRSIQGASVRPVVLLRAALEDLPGNSVILDHLRLMTQAGEAVAAVDGNEEDDNG